MQEFVASPDFQNTYPANRAILEIAAQIVHQQSDSMALLPVVSHWNSNTHHIMVGKAYTQLVRKYLAEPSAPTTKSNI